jgi:hypothetical protein
LCYVFESLGFVSDGNYLSVFSAPTTYRVVKITHSTSEVVLQTTKHTMIYPGLGPFLEVIAIRPVA